MPCWTTETVSSGHLTTNLYELDYMKLYCSIAEDFSCCYWWWSYLFSLFRFEDERYFKVGYFASGLRSENSSNVG